MRMRHDEDENTCATAAMVEIEDDTTKNDLWRLSLIYLINSSLLIKPGYFFYQQSN